MAETEIYKKIEDLEQKIDKLNKIINNLIEDKQNQSGCFDCFTKTTEYIGKIDDKFHILDKIKEKL